MDVLSSEENLSLKFIQDCHELMAETISTQTFMQQWLDLLEDRYDLHPLYFHLPALPEEKIFASNSKIAEFFAKTLKEQKKNTLKQATGYCIINLTATWQEGFIAIPESLQKLPIFPIFCKYAPFYLQIIHRIANLSAKLQLARLSLDLQNTTQELQANTRETSRNEQALSLLETFLSSSRKDHAFVYYTESKHYLCAEDTQKLIKKHQTLLDATLKNVTYNRSFFKNEELHAEIKSLILYPMFSHDDLFAIFGCFNTTRESINDLDLGYVCNFCTNISNINYLSKLLKN